MNTCQQQVINALNVAYYTGEFLRTADAEYEEEEEKHRYDIHDRNCREVYLAQETKRRSVFGLGRVQDLMRGPPEGYQQAAGILASIREWITSHIEWNYPSYHHPTWVVFNAAFMEVEALQHELDAKFEEKRGIDC